MDYLETPTLTAIVATVKSRSASGDRGEDSLGVIIELKVSFGLIWTSFRC